MWAKIAEEMQVPWRAAEAMHWQLGQTDMARHAGMVSFSLEPQNAPMKLSNLRPGELERPGRPTTQHLPLSMIPLHGNPGHSCERPPNLLPSLTELLEGVGVYQHVRR
jgi:hypothetical protein